MRALEELKVGATKLIVGNVVSTVKLATAVERWPAVSLDFALFFHWRFPRFPGPPLDCFVEFAASVVVQCCRWIFHWLVSVDSWDPPMEPTRHSHRDFPAFALRPR